MFPNRGAIKTKSRYVLWKHKQNIIQYSFEVNPPQISCCIRDVATVRFVFSLGRQLLMTWRMDATKFSYFIIFFSRSHVWGSGSSHCCSEKQAIDSLPYPVPTVVPKHLLWCTDFHSRNIRTPFLKLKETPHSINISKRSMYT